MDWTVLEIEGVEEVLDQAVTKVAHRHKYGKYQDPEELRQEALVITAKMGDRVRACAEGKGRLSLGTYYHELVGDLLNLTKLAYTRGENTLSADHRYAEVRDDSSAPAKMAVPLRQDGALYTRDLVESLMPAVWDWAYCYGMQTENAPDADMPRSQSNKATGNTLAAHLVDIKIGWEKTNLTDKERRALFLSYCMDWTHHEIAYNQECSRQTITERLATAVGKIVAHLNGVEWHNWEEVAA